MGVAYFTGYLITVWKPNVENSIMDFDENQFTYFFLPFILFNDGYSIPKKEFKDNAIQIIFYGMIGTVINTPHRKVLASKCVGSGNRSFVMKYHMTTPAGTNAANKVSNIIIAIPPGSSCADDNGNASAQMTEKL